jgi:hypothetical protein
MADKSAEKAPEKLSEKNDDARLTTLQRNAELIMGHLNEYLSIRFDHASRINPNLRHMKSDLLYHEMSNVRRTLLGEKIYGPVRMVVADVFLSDDDKKRRNLISPSDQTSIQVELVSHCQDDKIEATRGQIRFHDLKSIYTAMEPTLVNFIDLLETWIWWDIFDSVELVRFEQKLGKISLVRQGRLSEDARRRYAVLIHPIVDPDQPLSVATDDEILRYEFGQLQYIRDQWKFRHYGELGFKFVLKREEERAANQGEIIHNIAEKVREYDAIESMEELNEDMQHAYAVDLKMQPARVTKQSVLDLLKGQLVAMERDMLRQTDDEQRLGPPYNFKERQLEHLERWLNELRAQLGAILIKEPAPAPAPSVEAKPAPVAPAKPAPSLAPAPVAAPPKAPVSLPGAMEFEPLPGAMSISGTPGLNPGMELDLDPPVDPKLGF